VCGEGLEESTVSKFYKEWIYQEDNCSFYSMSSKLSFANKERSTLRDDNKHCLNMSIPYIVSSELSPR